MYKLTNSTAVIRIADEAWIPADESNSDYRVYLKWLSSGNTPEPVDEEAVIIPQSVTRFQALAALHQAGLLEGIEQYMQLPDTPFITQLAWREALNFERNSSMVINLAALLGMTELQVDELFTQAALIH